MVAGSFINARNIGFFLELPRHEQLVVAMKVAGISHYGRVLVNQWVREGLLQRAKFTGGQNFYYTVRGRKVAEILMECKRVLEHV